MGVQRGAGGCCGLINKGEWAMSVLGHVGLMEGLWLVEWGGGECERRTAGCLGRPRTQG
jgi:hypothetical protein